MKTARGPVSYTHLDVYKRQAVDVAAQTPDNPLSGETVQGSGLASPDESISEGSLVLPGGLPDVYKRQVFLQAPHRPQVQRTDGRR